MKTSFSRAFIPTALILLAALLLVGAAFQALVRNYLTGQVTENLQDNADSIARLAAAYYAEDSLDSRDFLVNLSIANQVSGSDAVICDASGKLLLCSDEPLGCEHQGLTVSEDYLQRVLSRKTLSSTGRIQGLYDEPRFVVAKAIALGEKNVGIVIVSIPTAKTNAVLQKIGESYLLVSVLVILVAVVFMTVLTRKQSAPLREMARAASDFGHGKLDARVEVTQSMPQEIRELALSFNNMASSLQKSEYQRQEFVANVSHELKTPMTTISGLVDGMLDGTIPPEKHPHYFRIVSDETKRLSRLVRSMLDISRLQDQGGIPEERKLRFDILECAGQVLITFEQKILSKDLSVQVDMPEHPLFTMADPDAITQVIYNLLDNAVKFCPGGGLLELEVREGPGKIYVSVSNEGETIPPEELPLVFDRFHKLDKSRSRSQEGWGLGLYIVKTLVCSHGEDISVSSHQGKTTFTFTLPLVN